MTRALLVAGLGVVLTACAVEVPRVPVDRFASGDVAGVAAVMEQALVDGAPENEALIRNVLGECELLRGDIDAAHRQFDVAGRIMGNWSTSGGEEFAAIVGSEGSKTYKGDPYEKGMNAFYLALTFLWRGEPDNARAALKRGILADGEVADEKYQADNPLLFWMAGRMSVLMGLDADAESFFAEAQTADEFAGSHGSESDREHRVVGDPRRGNVVLLIECGLGPEKIATGQWGALARFRPVSFPAVTARVSVGGQELAPPAVLNDVYYQARTLGGTEMEGIREGKAVFKTTSLIAGTTLLRSAGKAEDKKTRTAVAATGGVLLLLGALTSTRADVRCWPTLPATVQVLCADLQPGSHDLVIEFLDPAGRPLPELRQEWTIDVPEGGESWFLFRSLPGLDRAIVS
ncbi:MAG: hypothetical protein KDE27_18320 [Planctomycetes bacterium]|nr:hypothetical protein [Planctomycetota bacterium]